MNSLALKFARRLHRHSPRIEKSSARAPVSHRTSNLLCTVVDLPRAFRLAHVGGHARAVSANGTRQIAAASRRCFALVREYRPREKRAHRVVIRDFCDAHHSIPINHSAINAFREG